MTCDQASFLLERRWDKMLASDEEILLDRHLADCALCRAEAESIDVMDRAFQELAVLEPPRSIVDSVARQIAEEVPAESRRGWFWAALVAVTLAWAAVAHLGFTIPLSWTQSSQYLALSIALTKASGVLSDWLHPLAVAWKSLGPNLLPVLAIIAVAEIGLATLWLQRRSTATGLASQA